MQGPRKYHHGDLKNALVAAGIDILETEGLRALSLRAIAARVGVSHAAPRNHFGSLRDLQTAIAAEGFRRLAEVMQAGLPQEAADHARLDAAMRGYAAFARDHAAQFDLMFSRILCDHNDPALASAAHASYDVLRSVAAPFAGPGVGGAERAETMVWCLVHGYSTLAANGLLPEGSDGLPRLPVTAVFPHTRLGTL